MKFGVCTTIENSAAAKKAGWDFIELRVDQFIQGLTPDSKWKGAAEARKCHLPILAANVLVPPELKITGPKADLEILRNYITTVFRRCASIGIKSLVFGSGGARNVPGGFDRAQAKLQILEFLRMVAPIAQSHDIAIVVEHLNSMECNIINSISEAMTYVRELNHPNIRCLADSFHYWLNEEPSDGLKDSVTSLMHVHLADRNRKPPSEAGGCDYASFFKILKRAGYDRPMSVEAVDFNIAKDGRKVLEFIKNQWDRS